MRRAILLLALVVGAFSYNCQYDSDCDSDRRCRSFNIYGDDKYCAYKYCSADGKCPNHKG